MRQAEFEVTFRLPSFHCQRGDAEMLHTIAQKSIRTQTQGRGGGCVRATGAPRPVRALTWVFAL